MNNQRVELWLRESLENRGLAVEQLIGTGAFGRVYLVRKKGNTYAAKTWGEILACKCASNSQGMALLKQEALLLKEIQHPLFAQFEYYQEERAGSFLLMEYVKGESLGERLHRGALPQKEVVEIAIQLAEGLLFLHQLPTPVLYRDLKPENIRIGAEGRVKLLDLGCACALPQAQYSRAGTKGYAPVEQLERGCPGCCSDVYGLGKLMHYMLTGENPCVRPYRKSPIRDYQKKLSPYLECLIERCVEEDYRERLQDMGCVLMNLRQWGKREDFLYEKNVIETENIRQKVVDIW